MCIRDRGWNPRKTSFPELVKIMVKHDMKFVKKLYLKAQICLLYTSDEVIIDIWCTNQATIRDNVSPDGSITIPDLGLIYLNGMTIAEANQYLRKELNKI